MSKTLLLVIPPYYKFFGSFNNRVNLGALSLAAIFKQANLASHVLNLDHQEKGELLLRPSIFKNSQSPDMKVFKSSAQELAEQIKLLKPDYLLYAIGDVANPAVDFGSPEIAETLASEIKIRFPDLFQVGYGPFLRPNSVFDLNVFGHGEGNLVHHLLKMTKGSVSLDCSQEDFDRIPFLTLDSMIHPVSHQDFDYIWYSRGCLHECHFCVLPSFSQNRKIYRSSGLFVEEMKYRRDHFGVKDFYITDSTFNSSTQKLEEICRALQKADLGVTWRCDCRIDLISPEQLTLLKDAGCTYLKLGVEAMNDRRLEFMNKKFTVQTIMKNFELIKQSGLKTVVYILLGHPSYSEDDYGKELSLFKSLNADKYTVSILNPYPFKHPGLKAYTRMNYFPLTSHLSPPWAEIWNLTPKTLDSFFDLEISCGREDQNIRTFRHFYS